MALRELRGKDLTLALVRLVLEGSAPATIARMHRIPRWKVWFHLRKAEDAGILARTPGTRNPAILQRGPNAALLAAGWPHGRVGNLAERGSGDTELVARVHAVNFAAQMVAGPTRGDLRWTETGRWGNCRSWMTAVQVDGIGTVKLRRMGAERLLVYTPEFYISKEDMGRILDILALRVQGALAFLSKTYGYRFGWVKFNQQPEYAFSIDAAGIRELLAMTKPRRLDGKWWVDTSPGKGQPELETRDPKEADRYLSMPDRLNRLEGIVTKHDATLREMKHSMERVVTIVERQQANAEDLRSLVDVQLSRIQYMLQELDRKLERRTQGAKEN